MIGKVFFYIMNKIFSLIIPTRNRQEYVKWAVKAALEHKSDCYEVIVVDNSDDKNLIFESLDYFINDKRLSVIHSPEVIISMSDNWERGVQASTGEWVTIIGDDDLCDPSIIDFFPKLALVAPHVENLQWEKITYRWPDARDDWPSKIAVPTGNQVLQLKPREVLTASNTWNGNTRNPGFGASIYHGAFRRSLINLLINENKGKFFKYATPDFDVGYRSLIVSFNEIALCTRAFSIQGISKKSNSAGLNNYSNLVSNLNGWEADGNAVDGINGNIGEMATVVLTVINFQRRFSLDYSWPIKYTKEAMLKACEIDCELEHEIDGFHAKKNIYTNYLLDNKFIKEKNEFSPEYMKLKPNDKFFGFFNGYMMVSECINDNNNIYDLFKLISQFMVPINYIGRNINVQKM